MSENQSVDTPQVGHETTPEAPAKRLADTLATLRSMALDAMEEHRDALMELPEVYNHLQMIDRHLFNAAVEEERSRAPAPEPKSNDLPDLVAQLAPGEKFLLRSLLKAPNGINKHMLGTENQRLIDWGFVLAEGNLLQLSERGHQANQLLSLKPNRRAEAPVLAVSAN